MKTDEKRPSRDENHEQLRKELLERIVRNEARRRSKQSGAPSPPRKQAQPA